MTKTFAKVLGFHLHCGIGYTTLADLGLLLAPYDVSSLLRRPLAGWLNKVQRPGKMETRNWFDFSKGSQTLLVKGNQFGFELSVGSFRPR